MLCGRGMLGRGTCRRFDSVEDAETHLRRAEDMVHQLEPQNRYLNYSIADLEADSQHQQQGLSLKHAILL
eukprot:2124296-Rhodomonas_salina.1